MGADVPCRSAANRRHTRRVHRGSEARTGADPRLGRGQGQGVLRREAGFQPGCRPSPERGVPRRPVDAAGLGLLDRDRQGDHGRGSGLLQGHAPGRDRKSTRLNSSHVEISYAVFCLKKKKKKKKILSLKKKKKKKQK